MSVKEESDSVFLESQNHSSICLQVGDGNYLEGKDLATNVDCDEILSSKPNTKLEPLSLNRCKLDEVFNQASLNLYPKLKLESKAKLMTDHTTNYGIPPTSEVATSCFVDDAAAKVKVAESDIVHLDYKSSGVTCSTVVSNTASREMKIHQLNPVVILKRLSPYKSDFENNSSKIDMSTKPENPAHKVKITDSKNTASYKSAEIANSNISTNPYAVKLDHLNPSVFLKRLPSCKAGLENDIFNIDTSIDAKDPFTEAGVKDSKNTAIAYKCSEVADSNISTNLIPYEMKVDHLSPSLVLKLPSSCKAGLENDSINIDTSVDSDDSDTKSRLTDSKDTALVSKRCKVPHSNIPMNLVPYETKPKSLNPVVVLKRLTFCQASLNNSDAHTNFILVNHDTRKIENEEPNHRLENTRYVEETTKDYPCKSITTVHNPDVQTQRSDNNIRSSDGGHSTESEFASYVDVPSDSSVDHDTFAASYQETTNSSKVKGFRSRLKKRRKKSVKRRSKVKGDLETRTHKRSFHLEDWNKSSFEKEARKNGDARTRPRNRFRCEYCEILFSSTVNLKQHLLTHAEFRLHSCDLCCKSFLLKRYLKKHSYSHTAIKSYVCDHCGKSFRLKCFLKEHILKTHTEVEAHTCHICGKLFRKETSFKAHLVTHTGIKAFTCDLCGKSFVYKCVLNRHMISHRDTRAYKCEKCGKSFADQTYLRRHLLTHMGLREHTCEYCGKSFCRKSVLRIHLVTHTGVKAFSCKECGKSFNQRGSLKAHLLTHTGKKEYLCDQCGKSFPLKLNLTNHLLTHTGIKQYICNQCGKSFLFKSNLTNHLLTHTGIKQYKCNQCGKSFLFKSNLNKHLLTHTGIKPYICNQCGKSFLLKSNLTTHLLTHIGK